MELKYDQLNFEEVNFGRKLSFIQKVLLVVLVTLFISTPLYKISPETFQTNEVYEIWFDCFGYYYSW